MKQIIPVLFVAALYSGCGTGITAGQAIRTILPVAADALKALAAKKGATIDESGAVCFEVPEVAIDMPEFEGLDYTALMCVAAHLEE